MSYELFDKSMSGTTRLAITTYLKILKAEKRLEKLHGQLDELIQHIPEKEYGLYVNITTSLEKDNE